MNKQCMHFGNCNGKQRAVQFCIHSVLVLTFMFSDFLNLYGPEIEAPTEFCVTMFRM